MAAYAVATVIQVLCNDLLCACSSNCLSVCPFFFCLYVCEFVCLSVHRSLCLSVSHSLFLSLVSHSVRLSVSHSVRLSVCQSGCYLIY